MRRCPSIRYSLRRFIVGGWGFLLVLLHSNLSYSVLQFVVGRSFVSAASLTTHSSSLIITHHHPSSLIITHHHPSSPIITTHHPPPIITHHHPSPPITTHHYSSGIRPTQPPTNRAVAPAGRPHHRRRLRGRSDGCGLRCHRRCRQRNKVLADHILTDQIPHTNYFCF
jgi:hypothetical protein